MATETITTQTTARASQVRVHLKTNHDDLLLPSDIGSILVSTGREMVRYNLIKPADDAQISEDYNSRRW